MTAPESIGKSADKPYRKAAIFLNGTYPDEHLEFYRKAILADRDTTFVVAADGALNFFAKTGLSPNVVVGDFDSATPAALEQFPEVERQTFPNEKDATDGELAVRYVLDSGCHEIEIYGAIDTHFETDQMLANLFLLMLIKNFTQVKGKAIPARLTDHHQHIYVLKDESLNITGRTGQTLSIVPLSSVVYVTLKGTKWELVAEKLRLGTSRPLRNQLVDEDATVAVKGAAIVVHRHAE